MKMRMMKSESSAIPVIGCKAKSQDGAMKTFCQSPQSQPMSNSRSLARF